MRLLALVGLVGLLSGCGLGVEEAAAPDAERNQLAPESWCRSYTTEQYCPKYICAWHGTYCGLPAESGTETPEQAAVGTEPAAEETTQQGPSERWCNSYTSQQFCPSVCAWYSYPAPGYCGLKASSVTGAPEQSNECPGPAECTTNSDCDAKCGGPGTGACSAWTCRCSA
jgi:hypothetical protein